MSTTKTLKGGESQTLDLNGLEQGAYTVSCGVAGHKQAGMVAMLHLGTGASGGGTASDADVRAQNDEGRRGDEGPHRRVRRTAHEGCEHQGRRQPEDEAEGAGRRHEGVRPHGVDRRLGGLTRARS